MKIICATVAILALTACATPSYITEVLDNLDRQDAEALSINHAEVLDTIDRDDAEALSNHAVDIDTIINAEDFNGWTEEDLRNFRNAK